MSETKQSIIDFLESRSSSTTLSETEFVYFTSELRKRIDELAVSVPGASSDAVTVLYSGRLLGNISHTGAVAEDLANAYPGGIRTINQTEVYSLLDSEEFDTALRAALGPEGDATEELYDELIDGKKVNGKRIPNSLWDDASRRFAESATGEVRIIAPNARADRVLAQTELPALLENPNVTHIDGIPKNQILEFNNKYGTQALEHLVFDHSLFQIQLSGLADGGLDGESLDRYLKLQPGEYADILKDGVRFNAVDAALGDLDPDRFQRIKRSMSWATEIAELMDASGLSKVANKLGPIGLATGFMLAAHSASAAAEAGDYAQAEEIMAEWGVDAAGSAAGEAAGAAIGTIALGIAAAVGVTVSAPVAAVVVFGAALVGGIFGAEGATELYDLTKGRDDANKRRLFDKLATLLFGVDHSLTELPAGLDVDNLRIDTQLSVDEFVENANDSIAWRYALKHLTPFVVTGNEALYAQHNINGELDPEHFSGDYIRDRAGFLLAWSAFQFEGKSVFGNELTEFRDLATDEHVTVLARSPSPDPSRRVFFGTLANDQLTQGGDKQDHFYGQAGDDLLVGNGGNDYLEGGAGNDRLEGGAGEDRLYGGDDHDRMVGGRNSDHLYGGAGNDTYVFVTGDGVDTIVDTDGIGSIEFDGTALRAGERVADGIWRSQDGLHTLTLAGDLSTGGTLLIDDAIRIEQFHNNDLGIELEETVTTPTTTHQLEAGTSVYSFAFAVNDAVWLGDLVQFSSATLPFTDSIHFLGDATHNYLSTAQGDDFVNAGDGNDWIYSYQGNDKVLGGDGHDVIFTAWDEDEVRAGAGDDVVIDNLYWDVDTSGSAGMDEVVWSDVGWGSVVDVSPDLYFDTDNLEADFRYEIWPLEPPTTGTSVLGDQAYSYGFDADGYLAIDYAGLGAYRLDLQRYDAIDDKRNFFSGGAGNDFLVGNQGADVLMGEADDDKLAGNAGNDVLVGGEGLDMLLGGKGDDHLDGGTGADQIFGGSGSDQIFGGAGNDELAGDTNDDAVGAADRIFGHQGDDILWGQGGNDRLDGGAGNDILAGGNDDDELSGGSGEDTLDGGLGDDVLDGGAGADDLIGGDGVDQLLGGDGADELRAGKGADVVAGGRGDDALVGGIGDDLYLFDLGDGVDEVIDAEGANRLRFGIGITSGDIGLYRFDDGALALDYGDGDVVRLDAGSTSTLASIDFFDGTSMSLAQLTGERMITAINLSGSGQADQLQGGLGDDFLLGFAGDDVLSGSGGADELNGHDGHDTLLGGAGADRLQGHEGDDLLAGGLGADILDGGTGSDTYQFTIGDGEETLYEVSDKADETDVLRFGDAVRVADVAFARLANGDLHVRVGSAGDSLTVPGWFEGNGKIERFELADGTLLDTAFLATLPVTPVEGSDEDEALSGTQFADHLIGHAGDDLIDGRAGDDWLVGGAGNDVYVLGFDSGRDRLTDTQGNNRIRLNRGLVVTDLVRWREGEDLRLSVAGYPQIGVDIRDYYATLQSWDLLTEADGAIPVEFVAEKAGWATAADPLAEAQADYLQGLAAAFSQDRIAAGYQRHSDGTYSRTPVAALYATRTVVTEQQIFNAASSMFTTVRNTVVDGPDLRQVTYESGVTANTATLRSNVSTLRIDTRDVTGNLSNVDLPFWDTRSLPAIEIGFLAQSENLDWLPQSSSSSAQYTGGNYKLSTTFVSTSVNQTRGILGADGATVAWQPSETDFVVERLQGDASDNRITTRRSDQTVLDGRAGNDYLALGQWSSRHMGGFLAGGSGSDQLWGAHLDDQLAGGPDCDLLHGEAGSDRYLIDATASGIDLIDDDHTIRSASETGWSAYKTWYYASQGIAVAEPQVFDGPSLPPLPVADPTDFALVAELAADGVIDTDRLELSAGIAAQDLDLTWGIHDKGTLCATLNISWGDGRGARIVMPRAASGGALPSEGPPSEGGGFTPWVPSNWFEVEAGVGVGLEELALADGTVLSMRDLVALAGSGELNPEVGLVRIDGTSAAEQMAAEGNGGHLIGKAGDDTLRGGDSPDVLVGGTGNDHLEGGLGSDLYRYHLGDGADTLLERGGLAGEMDVIQFGENLQPDDAEVLRSGNDLILRFGSVEQQVRVLGWYAGADSRLEQVVFDEGQAWSATELEARAITINQAPLVNEHLRRAYVAEGGSLGYALPIATFLDPDVGDSLTLAASLADGAPLPSWLGFDPASGQFSGLPDGGAVGDYQVRVTATDSQGAEAAAEMALQVVAEGDALIGSLGDDYLWGSPADEVLKGLAGADILMGGAGDDIYVVDNVNDVVKEQADQGFDTVRSPISWTLGENQERLLLFGDSAIDGTGTADADRLVGNAGPNRLYGMAGSDVLNGRAGADTLIGGAGDDRYRVDNPGDVTIEAPGDGLDTVRSSVSWTLGANLERLVLVGDAAIDATGTPGDDDLRGNAAANTLAGLAGDDNIRGGQGDDTYLFARGDGADKWKEQGRPVDDGDQAVFSPDIAHDQLWFERNGNHLDLSILGTTDSIRVKGWFAEPSARIERLIAGDDRVLFDHQVQLLVDAMAAFEPPAVGETALTAGLREQLEPVLAAAWQPAST